MTFRVYPLRVWPITWLLWVALFTSASSLGATDAPPCTETDYKVPSSTMIVVRCLLAFAQRENP